MNIIDGEESCIELQSEISSRERLDIGQPDFNYRLFERHGLSKLFCDYYGIFNSRLFNTDGGNRLRRAELRTLTRAQFIMDGIFRLVYGRRVVSIPRMSPYLIYIGRKTVSGTTGQ